MWCNTCGEELSEDIDEAIHDETGDWINEQFGLPNEPVGDENSHIEVLYRDTGVVPRCRKENQFTKVVPEPPEENGDGNGADTEQQPEQNGDDSNGGAPEQKSQNTSRQAQRQQQRRGTRTRDVYDVPENKDPEDILKEVLTNEVFNLERPQVAEVMDWADIYDGKIPPDQLQELLSNMSGVQKQTAQLMRQKYEAKLNKWIQQQNSNDSGPNLGATYATGSPSMQNVQPNNNQQNNGPSKEEIRRRKAAQKAKQEKQEESNSRDRRQKRRQEAIDKAADQFAQNFAQNAAQGAGMFFKDLREIARTLFKKKAEKDPDWFFEKAEKWDMDLFDEIMTESEAKSRGEETMSGEPSADLEVDNALESVKSNPNNNNGMGSTEAQPRPNTQPQQPREPSGDSIENQMDSMVDGGDIDEMMMEDEDSVEESTEDDEEFSGEIDELLNDME